MERVWSRRLLFGAIGVILLIVLGYFARREFSISRCLDRGGRWNYKANVCDEP